jgi:cation diffusion facilitator CzcD-associated flavoprotein CzcO
MFDRYPAVMRGERSATFRLTELLNRALEGESAIAGPFMATMRQVWKAQLRLQVKDPDLRRKLEPDYPIGCKRILFSNDWYPALNREQVQVVTEAVTAVEPSGVVSADGTHHQADVLIWGTGFSATDFLRTIRVTGRDGVELHDVWKDGATAYLGIGVTGFPNLFCVYGPNTNLGGSSIIGMMEAQAGWIAQVVRRIADGNGRAFEVRPEVFETYDREMQDRLRDSIWTACDNWYLDGRRVTTNWPGMVGEYQQRLARVDWSALAST